MMIAITEHNSLIPVWMTLTFIHHDSSTRRQDLLYSFIAHFSSNLDKM